MARSPNVCCPESRGKASPGLNRLVPAAVRITALSPGYLVPRIALAVTMP